MSFPNVLSLPVAIGDILSRGCQLLSEHNCNIIRPPSGAKFTSFGGYQVVNMLCEPDCASKLIKMYDVM